MITVTTLFITVLVIMTVDSYYRLQKTKATSIYINELLEEIQNENHRR